jgi:hypothetical protein
MTLQELKKSIYKKVDDLNNRELLELIDELLTMNPEALEKSILTGYEQSEKGLTKPHSKVMQGFIDKYAIL